MADIEQTIRQLRALVRRNLASTQAARADAKNLRAATARLGRPVADTGIDPLDELLPGRDENSERRKRLFAVARYGVLIGSVLGGAWWFVVQKS